MAQNGNSSLFVTNPLHKDKKQKELDLLKYNILKWVKQEPKKVAKFKVRKGSHLLVIDPAMYI